MQFLIILFAIAAAVWLIPLVRAQRAIALPAAVLVVGVIFGPGFFAINGPVQISLDRVLWLVMLAYVAVHLRLGQMKLPAFTRTDAVVGLVTLWLLASCLRGGSVPDGSSPLARWIFYVALPIGMYVSCRVIPVEERDLRWFSRVLLGLGIYLAVTAVLEVSGLHAWVFPRHIVDSTAWEFFGRGRGPLLNPAGNGIVMATALVVAANEWVQARGRGRVVFVILACVVGCGLYATLTRSVWIGAAGALAVVALAYTPRWVRVLGLAASILFGGALALGVKDQFLQIKRDKHLTAADAEKSVQLRPLLAIVAWEMFKDRPLIGHGYGHYFEHSSAYHEERSYDLPLDQARPYMQHNVVLSLAVDAGLVGLVLLGICTLIWLSQAWQLASSNSADRLVQSVGVTTLGLFVAYFLNGMFQDVSIIPMMNMLLLSFAALSANLHASLAAPSCKPQPRALECTTASGRLPFQPSPS